MIVWFAGLAFVVVFQVFRDAAMDYRLVMLGALLPDLVDVILDGAATARGGDILGGTPAHTLLASVAALTVVMLATRRHRAARRRLLAVPIGMFVHLVLDGAWTRTEWFWWPFLGPADAMSSSSVPSLDRPVVVLVLQELAGAAALVWCARRFRLAEPENRTLFVTQGRLRRELVRG